MLTDAGVGARTRSLPRTAARGSWTTSPSCRRESVSNMEQKGPGTINCFYQLSRESREGAGGDTEEGSLPAGAEGEHLLRAGRPDHEVQARPEGGGQVRPPRRPGEVLLEG